MAKGSALRETSGHLGAFALSKDCACPLEKGSELTEVSGKFGVFAVFPKVPRAKRKRCILAIVERPAQKGRQFIFAKE